MFGFRSDLDPETLALLDTQVELAGKDGPLTKEEAAQLSRVNVEISRLGFKTTSSDPYYRAFIEALARRREILQLMRQPEQTVEERERIGRATDEVLAELADKHALKS